MRRFLALSVLLLSLPALAGIVGVFQGRIVRPKGITPEDGILFVRARNGMARKVKVEKAVVIEYDEDVPKAQRRKDPAQSLCDDVLVRVTAEQSEREDGEWRAINILILPEPGSGSGSGSGSNARTQKVGFYPEQSRKSEKAGTNGFCTP